MLSLFECTICSSSLSIEQINLFAIDNWIYHISDISRSFIMSFKQGLILLRYNCCSKNYLLLLVYNNFLLLYQAQKDS